MNKFEKQAKKFAHEEFDKLWQENHMTRQEAYQWLASKLKISLKKCHIGNFNESQCFDIERMSMKKLRKLRRENK
jgi:ribosomal protein L20A (L18A)